MTKAALVTTTISVPLALEYIRRADADIVFIVVGDSRTPHSDVADFLDTIQPAFYIHPDEQKQWRCSELIGWNCVQRRSIGFLYAIRMGAEILITWDTDNFPFNQNYIADFRRLFLQSFHGLQISSRTGWFNQYPNFNHRGFPIGKRSDKVVDSISYANIGVVAGVALGDADVDVYTRMAGPAKYEFVDNLTANGFVVSPDTHVVFNSQNTGFLRAFAPAMFMAPAIKRYDDIVASLLVQRLLTDQGYAVHIGPPFTYQERHSPTPIRDIDHERWGLEYILEVSNFIDRMPSLKLDIESHSIAMTKAFYAGCSCLPEQTKEAGLAWCEDYDAQRK